jgi:hypothetical protein
VFVSTAFWQAARAQLSSPVSTAALPGSLLERFEGASTVEGLLRFLDFIKPVTTGSGAHKTMGQ